jgi:uncharacterized protein
MANKITYFEVAANDGERARKFYESVFGWKIKKWEGTGPDADMNVWMIKTGTEAEPGIEGMLMLRAENPKTGQEKAFFCTISVDDLDAAVAKVKQAGGKVLDQMEDDEMGRFASAEDSEGNKFGIMEPKKK